MRKLILGPISEAALAMKGHTMTDNPPQVEDNEAQELAVLLAGLVRAEDAAFAMTDQPDSREVELLPCPFCGLIPLGVEHPHGSSVAYVLCGGCEGEGPIGMDRDQAIAAWNTRPALATTADRVAVLEAALRAIVDGDVPRQRGTGYRADGKRSKHDLCIHGLGMHDDCGNCIADFATTALATVDLPRLDLAKD